LRILQLAATQSEVEVETALALLLEEGTTPCPEVVHTLILPCVRPIVPQLTSGVVDLSLYDQLLIEGRRYEQPLY
jgi:hypothetical protein